MFADRAFAVVEDGSCIIGGCMDSKMPEYRPEATYDDGSCPPVFPGCTDSTAANYRPKANYDDGSCKYVGCMKEDAFNYDPNAALPGKCISKIYGCLDPSATNYRSAANTDSGKCKFVGCMDSTRLNYDSNAVSDNPGLGRAGRHLAAHSSAGRLYRSPRPLL